MGLNIDRFATGLILLTQSVGTDDFYPYITNLFKDWFDFDELLVLEIRRNADVKLLHRYGKDGIFNKLEGEDSWKYLTRLYVLDPFYRLFVDKGKYGFFSLDEIAPDEFSKVYNSYFNFLKLTDEIGYLFPIDKDTCLHIDLSIFGGADKFSEQTYSELTKLYTPFAKLALQHYELMGKEESAKSGVVEQVLFNFGIELLTKKEYQVCQLLLQGHSATAICNIMEIGYETVKMHKKNIYGKSFVSSQTELLALFIDGIQEQNLNPCIDLLAEHAKSIC